jgi:hypothetical protein
MRISDHALNSMRNAKLVGFVLRATLLSCRALLVDVRTESRWPFFARLASSGRVCYHLLQAAPHACRLSDSEYVCTINRLW